MTMQATVLAVRGGSLLVYDHNASQRVVVHTARPCRFQIGSFVCIRYNGIMTRSIPPQITAISISQIPRFGPRRNLCR